MVRKSLFKGIMSLIVIGIIGLFSFFFILPQLKSIDLEYEVKPESIVDKTLRVNLRISRNSFFGKKYLGFYSGAGNIFDEKCIDDKGNEIKAEYNGGIIQIGPLSKQTEYIDYSYKVKIGQSVHQGVQGVYLDDILVFNGENVFVMPYFSTEEEMDDIDKSIKSVSINVDVKKDWKAIMPYQNSEDKNVNSAILVLKPDWNTFYNISKSCFAFGAFKEMENVDKEGFPRLFVDPDYERELTPEVRASIVALIDFYLNAFGEGFEGYPIVLLRRHPLNDERIVGGVSGECAALTLDSETQYGWDIFSNTLYHGFFDSKVKARNLHYSPNLWLYKGLATYYKVLSMDYYPDIVKQQNEIDSNDIFKSLYNRYLYFRIKEPSLFKISPADEANLMGLQKEYYFYTEAPIVVKTIEDRLYQKSGGKDNLLRFILSHSLEKELNVGRTIYTLMEGNEAEIREYLSGEKLIPPINVSASGENPAKIIWKLDNFEKMIYNSMVSVKPEYPYDKVHLLRADKLKKELDKRSVMFASPGIEDEVKEFSPTLYALLKQYALRAQLCGEEDLNDPQLKEKLVCNSENVEKWKNFLSEQVDGNEEVKADK